VVGDPEVSAVGDLDATTTIEILSAAARPIPVAAAPGVLRLRAGEVSLSLERFVAALRSG
jgi:hypothetical protein